MPPPTEPGSGSGDEPAERPGPTAEPGSEVGPTRADRPGQAPARHAEPGSRPDAPVLPDTTRDETDVGWGVATWRDEPDDDERFLRERPPHWD